MYEVDGFPLAMLYHCFFIAHALNQEHKFSRLIMAGGSGCCLPTYIYNHQLADSISIVEIDPKHYSLARKYFAAPRQNRKYRVINRDIRQYFSASNDKFDLIFIDIGWNSNYDISSIHNVTDHIRQTIKLSKSHLTVDGYFLVNFISTTDQDGRKWLRPYLKQLYLYYKTILCIADFPDQPSKWQDVTLICCPHHMDIADIFHRINIYNAIPVDRLDYVRKIKDHIINLCPTQNMSDINPLISLHLIKHQKKWHGRAMSDSMFPLINTDDTVFFQSISLDRLKPLDIIAYQRPDGKIGVHRLIKSDLIKDLYYTKGDNLPTFSKPVHQKHILGKALYVKKNSGRFICLTSSFARSIYFLSKIWFMKIIIIRLLLSHKVQRIIFPAENKYEKT